MILILFFGHIMQLVGSYFPDQGTHATAVNVMSANHQTKREFPNVSLLSSLLIKNKHLSCFTVLYLLPNSSLYFTCKSLYKFTHLTSIARWNCI